MTISIRQHVDAVAALLTAAGLPTTIAEASDDAEPPFVVLWPTPGLTHAVTLNSPNSDVTLDFQMTCVGETAEQALWTHDKARAAIDRVTPTVSGRSARPIFSEFQPQPVRRDDAVNPPLFVAISEWSLRTSPS